jgi:hypothetical protein
MEFESVRFPLDRSKLAELSRAFHERDPVWHDPAVAVAAGFDGVPTPPTVTVLADHWMADGALSHATRLGLDLQRLLHGEVSWEYQKPLRMGDQLTTSTRAVDRRTREGKRGGTMTLVKLETTFTNQSGELMAVRRDTLVELGAGT